MNNDMADLNIAFTMLVDQLTKYVQRTDNTIGNLPAILENIVQRLDKMDMRLDNVETSTLDKDAVRDIVSDVLDNNTDLMTYNNVEEMVEDKLGDYDPTDHYNFDDAAREALESNLSDIVRDAVKDMTFTVTVE